MQSRAAPSAGHWSNLDPGERFVAEAGSMFRASSNVDIDVTTRSRNTGGIMSGIKRMIAGENFFFSTFTAGGNDPAEVGLAPTLQGECGRHRLRRRHCLGSAPGAATSARRPI